MMLKLLKLIGYIYKLLIEQLTDFNLTEMGETITVYIPTKNILNQEAIRNFAQYKNNVLQQLKGVIHHDV